MRNRFRWTKVAQNLVEQEEGRKMAFKISLVTVEPIVFFFLTAYRLNMVSLPQLLLENICKRKYGNTTKCAMMENGYFQSEYDAIQQQSAMWVSACVGLMAAIVICTVPTIAAISEVIGKRKALFMCPASLIFQNVFFLLIISSGLAFPTWLLILPNIIPALFGSVNGLFLLSFAYVSLITSEEERRMRITLVEAVTFLAVFVSTISSGLVIEKFGYMGTYVFNIVLQVLSLLYLVFLVKPVAEFKESRADNLIEDEICESATENGVKTTGFTEKSDKEEPPSFPNSYEIKSSREESIFETTTTTDAEKDGLVAISDSLDKDQLIIDATTTTTDAEKEGLVAISDGSNKDQLIIEETTTTTDAEKEGAVNGIDMANNGERKQLLQHSLTHQYANKSLKKEMKKALNPVANFKATISALRHLQHKKVSIPLLVAFYICCSVFFGEASIMIFYLKSHPFFMGARSIGFYLAFLSALVSVVGLTLFNLLLQKFLKISETSIIVLCTICGILYQILLGVSNSTIMLYSIQILNAMFSLSVPTVRSFISKMVEPEAVSTVLGVMSMVETLSMLTGSIVLPFSYAALLPVYNGAAFFVLAAILLVNLGITSFCAHHFSKTMTEAKKTDGKEDS